MLETARSMTTTLTEREPQASLAGVQRALNQLRVAPHHIRTLADAVAAQGITLQVFFERGGITAEQLDSWFTLDELDRLTVLAAEVTGDPALGLKWGEQSANLQYDLIPVLVAQAPSLRSSIDLVLRYQMMFAERPELDFAEKAGTAQFRCEPLALSDVGRRVRSEMLALTLTRMLRLLGGPAGVALKRVTFKHPAPPYLSEYERVFGSGIARFDQPSYGVEFKYTALESAQPTRNAELFNRIEQQVERGLARAVKDHSCVQQVLAYVRPRLAHSPEITDVSRALGISERSLRRKLSAEGSTFSQVVEQTQLEIAVELLSCSATPIKEITHLLGFASTSGFHRAFTRWTGISPTQYRAQR
jgi:AraC-like DNA-binding protein